MKAIIFVLFFFILNITITNAQMDMSVQRGSERIIFKDNDQCIVPMSYDIKNKTILNKSFSSKQNKLCELDFYSDEGIAICPKDYSTNPAVEVYDVSKTHWNKVQFESEHCLKDKSKRDGKKLAKFKQSITCSYTPSILGYYALSQLLKGAGNVPEAVIRTMPLNMHKVIMEQGISGRLSKMWELFRKIYKNPSAYPTIVTSDHEQIYGALSKNPTGENFYTEFYGPRHTYEQGLWAFLQTHVYKAITNPDALALPKKFNQILAQKIQAMKDASDMIIMDTMMNQQDRFGNVHSEPFYHYIDQGKLKSESAKNLTPEQISALNAKGAVMVKELLLKDNDCGVVKTNHFVNNKILETLRHISPVTYYAILKLALAAEESSFQDYLKNELLFTEKDINSSRGILTNLKKIVSVLKSKCKAKILRLDLDVETYLELKPAAVDCEL